MSSAWNPRTPCQSKRSMIKLEYGLDPSWDRTPADRDLSTADDSELHYDLFLGDVVIQIDGVDFSARWGWVPVLDFAICFGACVLALRNEIETTFDLRSRVPDSPCAVRTAA